MRSQSSPHVAVRILLVDDNNLGLLARKTVLEELGYQVTAASSASEALEHCAKHCYDILVTDYKMPRMNGVELIKRVKHQAPGMPAVLLSGFVDALGLDEATTGADVVIQKSSNELNHLVRSVARLMGPRSARKPPAAERPAARAARKSV